MPTGYTAGIEDGKITTGKDFLMICARAFGACIEMRDEPLSKPIPETFGRSEYHDGELAKAKAELAKYKSMSADEAQVLLDAEHERLRQEYREGMERANQITRAYNAVLCEVRAWNPPTPDHAHLKDFAIEQIGMCINDSMASFYRERLNRPKPGIEDWMNEKLKSALRDVDYHSEQLDKEIKRNAGRNEWIKALRDSLQ